MATASDGAPAAVDVVGLGEAMVLLEPADGSPLETGPQLVTRVGGAELNVCVAAARFGLRAAFCSRVGDDPFGRFMTCRVAELGVRTDRMVTDPSGPTGVYFKDLDPTGARHVYYYRRGSAAAHMDQSDGLRAVASCRRALVVSSITLALGPGPQAAVEAAVAGARDNGALVVLDPNLRPALGGIDAVRESLDRLLDACDVLLAGCDEAASLFGTDDPHALRRITWDRGIRELVLKDGADGSWVPDGPVGPGGPGDLDGLTMTHVPALPTDTVDAVGAGDAYAGTYLAARLAGKPPVDAGRLATKVAAGVVATPGDIEGLPPPDVARAWLHA